MKKNFFAIYALVGALVASPVFTSCVDDSESASVTALRGAKAEQLKSIAALNNAKAQAETTLAQAEAALKAAQAEYQNALAEVEKANAENQKELTKQAQEKFALEIAKLESQTEMYLLQYQASIETYKNQLEDAEYNRFNELYSRYLNELDELIGMQRQLVSDKNQLARLEADVITTEAYNQYEIKNQERYIAAYEAQLALLKDPAYTALDRNEVYAKYQVANKEASLAITAFNASEACSNLVAASNALEEMLNLNNELQNIVSELNGQYSVLSYNYDIVDFGVYNDDLNYNNKRYTWSGNTLYMKNIRIDETQKLQTIRYYESEVKFYAEQLGKSDDTKDKNTAYGRLAAANADMTTAKAMPETTDAEKAAKEQAIQNAEYAIAQATDNLADYQGWYNEAVEQQTKFNEALAEFDVELANKVGESLLAAIEANEEADEAYEEAREGVQEKQNAANALLNLYYNASSDIEQQILTLEQNIASCKATIEEYKVNSAEQTLANAKENIANLEAKIAVQEKVVADAKAAVDAYLATEEETPAE